jgi:hypothetical protein
MRLGLLADIHEHSRRLQKAITVLREHGAERFVVLGDVFDTGKRIEQTVRLLQEVQAVGVWGNHDVGFCFDPGDELWERYSPAVLAFMGSLQPHLEIDGCLFTHVEPWLDPQSIEDLWEYHDPPDSPEKLAKSFAAVSNRAMFIGHLHRWLLGTPGGIVPWRGETAVRLESTSRYLVAVHAVWEGRCALFDTEANELIPFGEADEPS